MLAYISPPTYDFWSARYGVQCTPYISQTIHLDYVLRGCLKAIIPRTLDIHYANLKKKQFLPNSLQTTMPWYLYAGTMRGLMHSGSRSVRVYSIRRILYELLSTGGP